MLFSSSGSGVVEDNSYTPIQGEGGGIPAVPPVCTPSPGKSILNDSSATKHGHLVASREFCCHFKESRRRVGCAENQTLLECNSDRRLLSELECAKEIDDCNLHSSSPSTLINWSLVGEILQRNCQYYQHWLHWVCTVAVDPHCALRT